MFADDFSKIIVENVDENQCGYHQYDDEGRIEATLKINLLEKGINCRVDNNVECALTNGIVIIEIHNG